MATKLPDPTLRARRADCPDLRADPRIYQHAAGARGRTLRCVARTGGKPRGVELQSFAEGLKKDYEAVKAGLTLSVEQRADRRASASLETHQEANVWPRQLHALTQARATSDGNQTSSAPCSGTIAGLGQKAWRSGNSGKLSKRDQHKGKRAFSSGLSALPFRERYQGAVHQRTLTSAQIASLLG